jgi:putative methyltransferase
LFGPHKRVYYRDFHIRHLFVFSPGTDFHQTKVYNEGAIIIQDKSSCFSAEALNPQGDGEIIDACAAPGNKTSHLLSLLSSSCKSKGVENPLIHAYEVDQRRMNILIQRLKGFGACVNSAFPITSYPVNVTLGSFLSTVPALWPSVHSILLDPTCSGSGVVNRVEHLHQRIQKQTKTAEKGEENENEEEKTQELAKITEFQLSALLHSMEFPSVHTIVYSTCSLDEKENEEIVAAAIDKNHNFELVPALLQWPRRGNPGLLSPLLASYLVRADPNEDRTNGFFVAKFQRKSKVSTAQPNPEPEPVPVPALSSGSEEIIQSSENQKKKRKLKKAKWRARKKALQNEKETKENQNSEEEEEEEKSGE